MREKLKIEEEDLDQASSLMSLFNPQRKKENSNWKQNATDKNSKEMLKVSNATVEQVSTLQNLDLKVPRNNSLSFGALFSYLFEN